MVVMDPHTGRVLAMVGGFSLRREPVQPRHAGQPPARLVVQAVRLFGRARQRLHAVLGGHGRADRDRSRAPASRSGGRRTTSQDYLGPSTLRTGIEQSRNVMTVRLAQDMGMPLVAEYARRFGIYDNLPPVPADGARRRRDHGACAWSPAYSVIANGGAADQPDADRPHPGPLRQDHLPPRGPRLRRLRRRSPGRTRTSRRSSTIASRCSTR